MLFQATLAMPRWRLMMAESFRAQGFEVDGTAYGWVGTKVPQFKAVA